MGHPPASGRLAIQATPISTIVAEGQFPADRIAPSTAPAPTYPGREASLRLPEFSANVTPVTSAGIACIQGSQIYHPSLNEVLSPQGVHHSAASISFTELPAPGSFTGANP